MTHWLNLLSLCLALSPANAFAQLTYFVDVAPIADLHDKALDLKDSYNKRATSILAPLNLTASESKEAARVLIEVRYAFAFSNGRQAGPLEEYWNERFKLDAEEHFKKSPEHILVEQWYVWDQKKKYLAGFASRFKPQSSGPTAMLKGKLNLDLDDASKTTEALVKHLIRDGSGAIDPIKGMQISLTADDTVAVTFARPTYAYQFTRPSAPSPSRSMRVEISYAGKSTFWWTPLDFESETYKLIAKNGWDIAIPTEKTVPILAAQWSRTRTDETYTNGERRFTLKLNLSARSQQSALFDTVVEASPPSTVAGGGLEGEVRRLINEKLKDRKVYETMFQKLDVIKKQRANR